MFQQQSQEFNYQVSPMVKPFSGSIKIPGDKSISHRAIMLSAIANGTTRIQGFLLGEDNLATITAFRQLGVCIDGPDEHGVVTVHGVGTQGLQAPATALDLMNSGTSIRLLSGLLAGQQFSSQLQGDESLMQRPMARIANPLNQMGAKVHTTAAGTPPVMINGGQQLNGIEYTLPMPSAQVKSAILLAALYAEGQTTVIEPAPTRDHTERMLKHFGYSVLQQGPQITLTGGDVLTAANIQVPADLSSAAFFLVAASIVPGSDVWLHDVGINPTRTGCLDILRQMGAHIELHNERVWCGEPVADIRVCAAELTGIDIDPKLVPLAIDEFPILFVAAAYAKGVTRVKGASELKVKESDRLQMMTNGLQTLGVHAEVTADGMTIQGGAVQGGTVATAKDHRIAMAFAVAALPAQKPITILQCANIATSFPSFVNLLHQQQVEIVKHN